MSRKRLAKYVAPLRRRPRQIGGFGSPFSAPGIVPNYV